MTTCTADKLIFHLQRLLTMRSFECIIHSNERKGASAMEINLSGFQMCHVEDKDEPKNVLREKRLILRMTQKQVADKANISLQQYQKFESGARNIRTCSFQIACRVIEALGMDISDFYHGQYVFGEEIYLENGVLKYKKTGMPVDEDILE